MRDETFSVKYISVHDCFLHFSDRWLEKFKDTNALAPVLKLEYGSRKYGYFSWSPESHSTSDNNIVGISATYAQKLGLKDKEKVTISVCSSVSSVSRINVSPVTADDWEILEMSSKLVQSSLLDQVRVVWSNQILVIWVSRSLHLSLHVDCLESNYAVGLLEPLSDVVVAPPGTNISSSETSVEHTLMDADLLRQKSQQCDDDQIKDMKQSQSLTSLLWNNFRNYLLYESDKKEDMLMKGPPRTEAERQSIAVVEKYKHKPLPRMYRVHPLLHPVPENKRKSGDYLLLQPYNVFVRRCSMPSVDAEFLNSRKGVLICKLIRAPDLSDSEISVSKHANKDDDQRHDKSTVSSSKTTPASVYVQLYVIEDIYKDLSDSMREYLDKVTINEKIGHNSLLVSDVARSVLGTQIGARVNLEVLTTGTRALPSEIQITPLENWEKGAKDLETLCRSYIAEQVRTHCLLINSKSFLPLQATSFSKILVLISLFPVEVEYAILDPDSVRKCKFTVKESGSHLVYPSVDKVSVKYDTCSIHLGGNFKKLLSEGLTTLELTLHLTPFVAKLVPFRTNLTSDNILILGTAGSGKTTLTRKICRELEKPPHFVHCIEVQCKHLKGKKVETLQKLMSQWLWECMYYQPSVLVFDDVDSIAGTGSSAPGLSISGENDYYTRVGERISELLEELQMSNAISILATAPSVLKVNSSLVAPRGRHIFKTVLEISDLNKGDRMDILKNIISHRCAVTAESAVAVPLNWDKIASRSEGYVVQDLVDLVDKAIFESCKRTGHKDTLTLEVDNSDFEEALNNSVPLSQRGVELYHGSSHSWDDIGGLSEVKKILVEVLQWPSQYPEIFEHAPLRLQSGLLLYGAPGTGKTLLAGAVAKECGLKFISIKGPELLSKYIGASEEAVRNIFRKAQSAKPCVLFFDEFDSLAPRRGHDSTGVTDRVVNQLLTQLDGVESLHGVWVVAATSRPDLIDPALLRPGRLDKNIKCPLPDRDDRLSILQALSRKVVLSDDIDFGEIADNTEGFTGADLQAVLYTALLKAVEQITALREDPNNKDENPQPIAGDSSVKSRKISSGPVVNQATLKAALRDTKPSLSLIEKLKYHLIYEKFERSHGGTSAEDMASMPQRATLA